MSAVLGAEDALNPRHIRGPWPSSVSLISARPVGMYGDTARSCQENRLIVQLRCVQRRDASECHFVFLKNTGVTTQMSVFRQLPDLAVPLHHRCQDNNLSVSANTALFNDSQAKAAMSVLALLRGRAQHGSLMVIPQ